MKFTLEDVEYEFDETRLLVREARELKHYTGMGLKAFGAGLEEGDPDALVGMFYLARRRTGEPVKWSDFDDINLAALDMAQASVPDPAEGDEASPVDLAITNGAVHTGPPVGGVDEEVALVPMIS